MGMKMSFQSLVTQYDELFFAALSPSAQGFIKSDRLEVDPFMEIDDFLQFTLLENVKVPLDLLQETRRHVEAGWDPEIKDRTLRWIEKHIAATDEK